MRECCADTLEPAASFRFKRIHTDLHVDPTNKKAVGRQFTLRQNVSIRQLKGRYSLINTSGPVQILPGEKIRFVLVNSLKYKFPTIPWAKLRFGNGEVQKVELTSHVLS